MNRNTKDTLGLFAFLSLIIFTISFILNRFGVITNFFTYLGYGIILFLILILAKMYVDKLNTTWKLVYYIIAIFTLLDYFFMVF